MSITSASQGSGDELGEGRLLVIREVDRALAASGVRVLLRMWAGVGDWADWPVSVRDKAGRSAVKEVDAAIDQLVRARRSLVEQVHSPTDLDTTDL